MAIIELELTRTGEDETRRQALRGELARGFFVAAQADGGVRRLVLLQEALELAQDMPGVREPMLVYQQELDPADLGLQSFQVAVVAPPRHPRELNLFSAGSWTQALDLLLAHVLPCGDHARNVASARQGIDGAVLGAVATTLVLNLETRQARPVETDDQHLDEELGELERRTCSQQIHAFVGPLLQYLPVQYDITSGSLRTWLGLRGAPRDAVCAVGDALSGWWEGEGRLGVACALTAAIEHLVRHHVDQRGMPVTTVATALQRGGVRPLGELLGALARHLDDSWRRSLRCVLVAETGYNLRNRLSHGLHLTPDDADVAALAWMALYLCRLP